MAPIRLLHASDLHIAYDENVRSMLDKWDDKTYLSKHHDLSTIDGFRNAIGDLLSRASTHDPVALAHLAEFIYREMDEDRLHGVILTGDLATTGDEEDIGRLDQFLNDPFDPRIPYRRTTDGRPTLQFIKCPFGRGVFQGSRCLGFFAGNHDRFETSYGVVRSGKSIIPKIFDVGGRRFDTVKFGGNVTSNISPINSLWMQREMPSGNRLTICLLMADLSLKRIADHDGLLGWIAQGRAYPDVIKQLKAYTRTMMDPTPPSEERRVIWGVHFPPQFPGVKNNSTLLEVENLIAAANEMGVTAILSGHTHRALNYDTPGLQSVVLCCGTSTQFEPLSHAGGRHANDLTNGNHLQILNFDEDPAGNIQLSVEHYKYFATGSHYSDLRRDMLVMNGGPKKGETNWRYVSTDHLRVI